MSGTDVSIALGLPVGIDPPIALPPRKEESKEKQKSRFVFVCICARKCQNLCKDDVL